MSLIYFKKFISKNIHSTYFNHCFKPVLWADEDGVFTDPVLLQREKVYFSVGLDGSSFISLSPPILPPLRIAKFAISTK